MRDAAGEVDTYAGTAGDAAKEIEDLMGDLPDDMYDFADRVRNILTGSTYQLVSAGRPQGGRRGA